MKHRSLPKRLLNVSYHFNRNCDRLGREPPKKWPRPTALSLRNVTPNYSAIRCLRTTFGSLLSSLRRKQHYSCTVRRQPMGKKTARPISCATEEAPSGLLRRCLSFCSPKTVALFFHGLCSIIGRQKVNTSGERSSR